LWSVYFTGQADLTLDADVEKFWNFRTKKAIADEYMTIAYESGLPVYHEMKKRPTQWLGS
jgi:hypothetical protein